MPVLPSLHVGQAGIVNEWIHGRVPLRQDISTASSLQRCYCCLKLRIVTALVEEVGVEGRINRACTLCRTSCNQNYDTFNIFSTQLVLIPWCEPSGVLGARTKSSLPSQTETQRSTLSWHLVLSCQYGALHQQKRHKLTKKGRKNVINSGPWQDLTWFNRLLGLRLHFKHHFVPLWWNVSLSWWMLAYRGKCWND